MVSAAIDIIQVGQAEYFPNRVKVNASRAAHCRSPFRSDVEKAPWSQECIRLSQVGFDLHPHMLEQFRGQSWTPLHRRTPR
jgi:hypothetical protein